MYSNKNLFLLTLILLLIGSLQAQVPNLNTINTGVLEGKGKHLCGTVSPSYEQNEKDLGDFVPRQKNNGFTQLPMRVHIVTLDDGTGGVSLDIINRELANLNYAMAPEQIEWFIKEINYINNSSFYDFTWTFPNEEALCNPHQVNDAVNVFWVNSIDSGAWCGYAYYPSNAYWAIRVFMANDCAGGIWSDTFVHEFGHHLNLYHTHQGTENGPTHPDAEHVPRTGSQSNCSTAGDLLCDTEADPQGTADSNCNYTGGGTDIYGNPYTPDVDNIMSYYPDACGGTLFTPGQYTRIDNGLSARLGHTAYDIDGATPNSVADPSGLTASVFLGQITLNWVDNSSNETGFLVERSIDGTNFFPIPYWGVGPNTTSAFDVYNINPYTTYYYRVKASNDNPDHYSNVVSVTTGSTSNYTCSTAYPIPGCGWFWSHGPNQGNGASHTDATHAVWYSYTPDYTGTIDLHSCLGYADTRLYVYSGSCGALTLLASNDDACPMTPGGLPYASEVLNVPVTKDIPIYIEWDDRWSQDGFWFYLEFTSSALCSEIENINSAGTYTIDEIPCTNFALNPPAENAKLYRFTPPTTGVIDITSCGEGVNTNLWVYGGTCSSINMIASSDDDCNAGSGQGFVASEVIGLNVTAGVDIWLEWDDLWSSQGFDFTISYQGQGNCPSSLNLTGNQTVSNDFETDGVIISDQVIGSGITVDYDSGTSISLEPGFQINLGAIFNAFIDGCGGSQ